jgi:prefoldin subunit 5
MNAMTERLQTLQGEYQTGQRQLEVLNRQLGALRDTLLRIAGAIQVIEELLSSGERPPLEPADPR